MEVLIYAILIVILLRLIDSRLPLEVARSILGLFFCIIVVFMLFAAMVTMSPIFFFLLMLIPLAVL